MAHADSLKTGKKYKKTEIGEIPVDWEVVRIDDICEVVGGSTPSTNKKEYWNGDILWAIPTDITKLKGNIISDTEKKITEKGLSACAAKVLPEGSILITSRATIGECAINTKPMATNQGFASLKCKENIHNWFIFYKIAAMRKKLEKLGSGSTFKETSKKSIRAIKMSFPPFSEQKKIAEILLTVDDAIEKSNEIIEKTKELKKGLMQQLLTRGIGHTKFKKTKIGEIPVNWEVKQISEVVGKIIDNRGKTPPLVDKGYELIEVNAIGRDSKFPNHDNVVKFVDTETYQDWFRDGHPAIGDVLIPTVGTIGVTAIMNENRGCIAQNIIAVRAGANMNPEYFYYFTNSSLFLIQIHHVVMSAVQPSLKVPHFLNFLISVPPPLEQKKIAEILTSVDEQIEKENANKEKLEMLKKSLMQILLTGKVRVRI
jgi:type I restriction enzyme S subunit